MYLSETSPEYPVAFVSFHKPSNEHHRPAFLPPSLHAYRSSVDEVSLLLAVTVFILHCPKHVVCSPNVAYPAINAFTQCFQSKSGAVRHRDAISVNCSFYHATVAFSSLQFHMFEKHHESRDFYNHQIHEPMTNWPSPPLLQLRCVLALHSIFAHEDHDVASVYIQSLSPKVIEYLLDDASRNVSEDIELLFTIECVKLLEVMVRAQDDSEKRQQLMEFLLPILVSHLGRYSTEFFTREKRVIKKPILHPMALRGALNPSLIPPISWKQFR